MNIILHVVAYRNWKDRSNKLNEIGRMPISSMRHLHTAMKVYHDPNGPARFLSFVDVLGGEHSTFESAMQVVEDALNVEALHIIEREGPSTVASLSQFVGVAHVDIVVIMAKLRTKGEVYSSEGTWFITKRRLP